MKGNLPTRVSAIYPANLAGSPNNKASSGYVGDFGDKSDPNPFPRLHDRLLYAKASIN